MNPQTLRFYESFDANMQPILFGPDPTGVAVMLILACLAVGQLCQLISALQR